MAHLCTAPLAGGVINYANSAVVPAKLSTFGAHWRREWEELEDVDIPSYLVLVNKAKLQAGALVWKLLDSVNTVTL